jgi:molybdate transport system substrate-binding protein
VNRRLALLALLTTVAVAGASSCGASSDGGAGADGGGKITVFAASSLTDAFNEMGDVFGTKTGTSVTFSFAGSQNLVTQIQQGAPADVLATADTATMDSVADELAGESTVFAHNTLVIVTAPGNPNNVRSLADLPALDVILADPSVPAGEYAAQALDDAGVTVKPKSLELEVRSVLTKVELGEADAGIVYATDATTAGGDVTAVSIADSPTATYPVAPVTDAGKAFADFVSSSDGAAILQKYGFLPP